MFPDAVSPDAAICQMLVDVTRTSIPIAIPMPIPIPMPMPIPNANTKSDTNTKYAMSIAIPICNTKYQIPNTKYQIPNTKYQYGCQFQCQYQYQCQYQRQYINIINTKGLSASSRWQAGLAVGVEWVGCGVVGSGINARTGSLVLGWA
jgi:hypothetical protein